MARRTVTTILRSMPSAAVRQPKLSSPAPSPSEPGVIPAANHLAPPAPKPAVPSQPRIQARNKQSQHYTTSPRYPTSTPPQPALHRLKSLSQPSASPPENQHHRLNLFIQPFVLSPVLNSHCMEWTKKSLLRQLRRRVSTGILSASLLFFSQAPTPREPSQPPSIPGCYRKRSSTNSYHLNNP